MPDLREHLRTLDAKGLLWTIKEPVNKDSELMCLARWQYRGLPPDQRKGFWFTNVIDAHGKHYPGGVAVSVLGANPAVYATALNCQPETIVKNWQKSIREPLAPRLVEAEGAPAKEEVHRGDALLEHGGVAEFPVPISLPGFDPAPFFTATCVITKDPETGVRNVGTYRLMLKAPGYLGLHVMESQHLHIHLDKCRALGKPLEVAVAVGAPPSVSACAAAKVPYGMDELTVAGALIGQPIDLVKCETVDLEVPASSEIVLEGLVDPNLLEAEGPHGESRGYVRERCWAYTLKLTAITHRKDPICQVFLSQMPPSESSLIRRFWNESNALTLLRDILGIRSVLDVAFPEEVGSYDICVIRMKNPKRHEVWRALHGVSGLLRLGKIAIAVDEDIDPWDADSVNFALATRMQPHKDMHIYPGKTIGAEMAAVPPWSEEPAPIMSSGVMIDATRKWPLPPIALPGKPQMERAREIWEKLGLPTLHPRGPWFGVSLGFWSEENEREAQMAIEGRYFDTGEKLARMQVRYGEVGVNSAVVKVTAGGKARGDRD